MLLVLPIAAVAVALSASRDPFRGETEQNGVDLSWIELNLDVWVNLHDAGDDLADSPLSE